MGFLKLIVHFFFVFSCRGWSVGGVGVGTGQWGGGGNSNGVGRKGGEGWCLKGDPNKEEVGAPKGWGAERWGAPKGGGPEPGKGGAPKGRGPRRVGRPKISRFFFPFPATVSLFLCLSGGLLVGILVVFGSAGAVKCARLEFSGCRVKPRRPQSRGGFTPQPEAWRQQKRLPIAVSPSLRRQGVIWNRRRIGR